jgi:ubiquitin carboxyl-terminal hydrolase 7
MSQKVGEFLRQDPLKLRFTTTYSTGTLKAILKHSLNQTISEIIAPSYLSQQPAMIVYELLDVSIIELETRRLKVVWIGINEEQSTHSFLLSRMNLVNDLCNELAECVKLTPNGTNKIRVFQISKDGKRQDECMGNAIIGDTADNAELFAEEVSQEELDALSVPERAKIIMVYHFYLKPTRAHGVPFHFVLRPVRQTVSVLDHSVYSFVCLG